MAKPSQKTAAARKTKTDWMQAARELLAEGGINAVRVEPLARALGVTKGSFYWHFADRPTFHQALLEYWEAQGTSGVIEAVESSNLPPKGKLGLLWSLTSSEELGAELAIRDWARRDDAAQAAVARVDNKRMTYLCQLYGEVGFTTDEAEARSLLAYSLLIGNHFIASDDDSKQEAVRAALRLLSELGPNAG